MSETCYYCGTFELELKLVHGKRVCEFCEHLAHEEHFRELTPEILREFYTAQYKAALLGLIQFAKKTPDELIEEVSAWLHYTVDAFNNPMKRKE